MGRRSYLSDGEAPIRSFELRLTLMTSEVPVAPVAITGMRGAR